MKTAQDIINIARGALITHITTLVRKIDGYLESGSKRLMTDPGESAVLDFVECAYVPTITVEVDYPYLEEVRTLDFIATSGEHNFYVGAGENTDINADDLSTDELVVIAKCLEKTYGGME